MKDIFVKRTSKKQVPERRHLLPRLGPKHIVIINGSGGVGKDTFVELCGENCAVENFSSVDPLRHLAESELGWTNGKSLWDRSFIAEFKALTDRYCNYSTQKVFEKINEFLSDENKDLLFIHIREPENIEKVVNKFPQVKTLLITNSRVKPIKSNEADANVDFYDNYDYQISNEGSLEDLRKTAFSFLAELQGEDSSK